LEFKCELFFHQQRCAHLHPGMLHINYISLHISQVLTKAEEDLMYKKK